MKVEIFRLFNSTTAHDVIDADSENGSPCEFTSMADAQKALDRVNDLKRLNPKHANDEIVIYKFTEGI